MERKYCEDCRFCDVRGGISLARCTNPAAPEASTGDRFVSREMDKPKFASSVRLDNQACGADARWFEARAEQVAA